MKLFISWSGEFSQGVAEGSALLSLPEIKEDNEYAFA